MTGEARPDVPLAARLPATTPPLAATSTGRRRLRHKGPLLAKRQLDTLVGGDEAEAFVEAVGIGS